MQDIKKLKLYSFQPNGHGEVSAFVMAYSEKEAREKVKSKAENHTLDIDGFDTDYYDVGVWDIGDVVFNEND